MVIYRIGFGQGIMSEAGLISIIFYYFYFQRVSIILHVVLIIDELLMNVRR